MCMGANRVRRGQLRSELHAEVPSARKTGGNTIRADDYAYALAA